MTPQYASTLTRLHRSFLTMYADDVVSIRSQLPLKLADGWEPRPAIAVVAVRNYEDEHPGLEDIFVLAEISDGSELPRYAAIGIPEVWIVDLPTGVIRIHRDPQREGHYGSLSTTSLKEIS